MRVRLKGINRVRKRLADGRDVTYYYAWRGGPRLVGSPGSAEFVSSYNEAVAGRHRRPRECLVGLINAYLQSPDFAALAPRTQRDYRNHFKVIGDEFGDFPLSAIGDTRTRGLFLGWRDKAAAVSPRTADYRFMTLARLMSWSLDRGLIPVNPCKNPGRTYRGSRADSIWSEDDEAAFMAVAAWPMALAMQMALWTGQRQGDLLKMRWNDYDGARVRLSQGKTGARLTIPIADHLRGMLERERERTGGAAPTILSNQAGQPWTGDGFRTSWARTAAKAGVSGRTFHDLRGTAVTRLAIAGCTVAEIASITGHSLRDAETILSAHYLSRDPALAKSAMEKLQTNYKLDGWADFGRG